MKVKKDEKICIMIVPHTDKVKRVLIPAWLPKASIILLSTFFVGSFTFLGANKASKLNLEADYKEKIAIIDKLEKDNREKDSELSNLKSQTDKLYSKTSEVNSKLDEIDKLQKRLEEMANIKSPSRGGAISRDINLDELEPIEGIEVISEVLDDKKLELEVFIQDLESQFAYLECVPNLMPTYGRITSRFGSRRDPIRKTIRFHQGVDIANSRGTSVKAAANGKVIFSGYQGSYGKTIIIDHGYGYKTLYGHNSSLLVNVGDYVKKGQAISKMGSSGRSTGSHLHFEVHKNDKPIDPFSVLD
ncbi:MAG: peptidoglycan DD-metalloendopeptidase family protein [Tissierellaceae bacterium]